MYPRLLSVVPLLVLVLSGLSGRAGAEVELFGPKARVFIHADLPLTADQQRGLEGLRTDPQYFGAMAILPGSYIYANFRGFHSWDMAIDGAVSECRRLSLLAGVQDRQCVLIASVIPKGLDEKEVLARGRGKLSAGLGQGSYFTFTGAYRDGKVRGTYGAFAISNFAQDGYSLGLPTRAMAEDWAVGECEAAVARAIVPYSRDVREYLREEGLDRCRVVDVQEP